MLCISNLLRYASKTIEKVSWLQIHGEFKNSIVYCKRGMESVGYNFLKWFFVLKHGKKQENRKNMFNSFMF